MASSTNHSSTTQMKTEIKRLRRLAFSELIHSKSIAESRWRCCGGTFERKRDIHKHVSVTHHAEAKNLLDDVRPADAEAEKKKENRAENCRCYLPTDVCDWLPKYDGTRDRFAKAEEVLLFYTYCDVTEPDDVKNWQRELARRLKLTGKVRVAGEGVNGSVAGARSATAAYMSAFVAHPAFRQHMRASDFKKSDAVPGVETFPGGFQVRTCDEIVPMGIKPSILSHSQGGRHMTPEDFHQRLSQDGAPGADDVFVDCRNFYESCIGNFARAVQPNLRKFSYWPEFVDANLDNFADKNVFMYCTGGIRCERASAYLKEKKICKEVYQLEGGIHRYMEMFPTGGLFRGKLFVFDGRFAIDSGGHSDLRRVISKCVYCSADWDSYSVCSSSHCHQLVLSCAECQGRGQRACCRTCAADELEECECTWTRTRPSQGQGHRNNREELGTRIQEQKSED